MGKEIYIDYGIVRTCTFSALYFVSKKGKWYNMTKYYRNKVPIHVRLWVQVKIFFLKLYLIEYFQ